MNLNLTHNQLAALHAVSMIDRNASIMMGAGGFGAEGVMALRQLLADCRKQVEDLPLLPIPMESRWWLRIPRHPRPQLALVPPVLPAPAKRRAKRKPKAAASNDTIIRIHAPAVEAPRKKRA